MTKDTNVFIKTFELVLTDLFHGGFFGIYFIIGLIFSFFFFMEPDFTYYYGGPDLRDPYILFWFLIALLCYGYYFIRLDSLKDDLLKNLKSSVSNQTPQDRISDLQNQKLINAVANSCQDPVIAKFLKKLAYSDSLELLATVAAEIRGSPTNERPLPSTKKGLLGTNFFAGYFLSTSKQCYNCNGSMVESVLAKPYDPGLRYICQSCGYFVLIDDSSNSTVTDTFGTVIHEGLLAFNDFQ